MPFGGSASSQFHNPNNGYLVPHPPDDTISRLRFSPSTVPNTYLLASSWNGSIRCWKVDATQGLASAISEKVFPAPVLDCTWSTDGQSAFTACADKLARKWDLATNTETVVAGHEDVIRQIAQVDQQQQLLVTASWDKNLCYWDARQPTGNPACKVNLGERVYAMDSGGPLLVLGLAERKLLVFDVRKPTQPFEEKYSQLKTQTRCVATWPNNMGYVVGGVGGKVSVDHVSEPKPGMNYKLACHQSRDGVSHAVNAVRFHQPSGAFATVGSDGMIMFWDKDRKDEARMRKFESVGMPIVDVDFSAEGSLFAYAVGYDWSMGASGRANFPDHSYIVLHAIKDGELQHAKNTGGYRGRGRGRGRGRNYHNR